MAIYKAFALTGRLADWHYTQGAALGYELLPFQGVLLVSITPLGYELLPFQGVLLVSITILGYALGPSARACPRAILEMFNFISTKAFVLTPLTPLTPLIPLSPLTPLTPLTPLKNSPLFPLLLRVRQESGNDAEQRQEGAYLEDELDAGLVC